MTSTNVGALWFASWVTRLNITYSPSQNISGNTARTVQPTVNTVENEPAINGTIFLVLTDSDLYNASFDPTQFNPDARALRLPG